MKPDTLQLLLSLASVLVIIASAWLFKDTAYENAWFYIFCVWIFIFSGIEIYSKKKNKGQ